MHLDFDDDPVIPSSMSWTGYTYTTNVTIAHSIPRKARLCVRISGWLNNGRYIEEEVVDITEEVSRDPLEQLRVGAIVFELWCIKKGVSSETQNQ